MKLVVKNGSRQVIINSNPGDTSHFWSNLYVNNGETITNIRGTHSTLAGAKRWAEKQLAKCLTHQLSPRLQTHCLQQGRAT